MLNALIPDALAAVRQLCDTTFFGARILCALDTYGIDDNRCRIWCEREGTEIRAVLLVSEAAATLVAADSADFNSLASLVLFAGAKCVTGAAETVCRLPFPVTQSGSLMRADYLIQPPPQTVRPVDAEGIAELYDVLYGAGARAKNPAAFAAWFPDISHRVRHKTSSFFAVYSDDRPVSCAGILYESSRLACIGAVATLPAYRRRGYAAAVTAAAAAEGLARGKTPLLARNGDKTKALYESLGFCDTGKWARGDAEHGCE